MIRPLWRWGALLIMMAACSPAPTPAPTATVAVAQASEAYGRFLSSWLAEYQDILGAQPASADADSEQVITYARELADAYAAFANGVRAIEFPDSLRPAVLAELDAVSVLVALSRQIEDEPSNLALRTQLLEALGRVGERSANLEAALGVFH